MLSDIVMVDHIGMKYQSPNGEINAVEDVSFTVNQGEYISLVGPSGCGKSTLLSIVSGLLIPTSGCVSINGEEVKGTSKKVGYMLQKDHLFDWRTIYQNVVLGLEIRGLLKKENIEFVLKLLKTYGLYEFSIKRTGGLFKKNQNQKIGNLRSASANSHFLFCCLGDCRQP